MSDVDGLTTAALRALGPKPLDTDPQKDKKRYSERLSEALAHAFAAALRERGLGSARPAPPGELDSSGAERRMSGGIGAKKVDVTWATEESGLLLGISIKSINFRDQKTGNFQKNLTNRRGDMLFEAVTLHRRFPYAVLAGFLILDEQSAHDQTGQRQSTFLNCHQRFRLFTGRRDPAGREEQYEFLYIVLHSGNVFDPTFQVFQVGAAETAINLNFAFEQMLGAIAERNPDFYAVSDGMLVVP